MKKILSIITTVLLLLVIAVSCAQDVTVDTQLYGAQGSGTFMLNGKYYNTLQEAVNARLGKGAKAAGANDDVIYLTRNAKGPGAKIDDPNISVIIDFAGWTYSFTDVTATQGSTSGTFGLSITDGADVTLKGLEQIDLHDTTANLTMVYVEGADTKLTIEDAPKMKVEPSQYVFWAANGATLTVGGKDANESATISGKVAATGTTESKPTIELKSKTTITGSVEAESAKVTIAGTSKVTGSIDVKASTVSVSETAKIDVDLTAKNNSEVVINTASAGVDASTLKTMDKDGDSTVVVAGGGVNVEDVATGSDNTIVIVDGGAASGSGIHKDETTSVYVAKNIKKSVYKTLNAALADASDGDEIKLLENIGEETLTNTKSVTVDLNGKDVGTPSAPVTLTLSSGTLSVDDSTSTVGIVYIDYAGTGEPSADALKLYGGKFLRFEDGGSYYDALWEYLGKGYKFVGDTAPTETLCEVIAVEASDVALLRGRAKETLQAAITAAAAGDTVFVLQDIDFTSGTLYVNNRFPISKSITIDGYDNTITVAQKGFGVGMNATSLVDVTFKDITINNSASGARCIDTRGNIDTLTLENVSLSTENSPGNYDQPLTIGGDQNGTTAKIIIKNSSIKANKYYPIITFNRVNMQIDNTTIEGYCCFYLKAESTSDGSTGSIISVKNSNLISKNVNDGSSNGFGTVNYEDSGITVQFSSCNFKTVRTGTAMQAIISISEWGAQNKSNVVYMSSDCKFESPEKSTTPLYLPSGGQVTIKSDVDLGASGRIFEGLVFTKSGNTYSCTIGEDEDSDYMAVKIMPTFSMPYFGYAIPENELIQYLDAGFYVVSKSTTYVPESYAWESTSDVMVEGVPLSDYPIKGGYSYVLVHE